MTDSPLKQNGNYKFRVLCDGKEREIININVDGRKIFITGPNWIGRGIAEGEYYDYLGYTYLNTELAFHDMGWIDDRFDGSCIYENGSCDLIQWVLITE